MTCQFSVLYVQRVCKRFKKRSASGTVGGLLSESGSAGLVRIFRMADDGALPVRQSFCGGQMARAQRDNGMGWTQEKNRSPGSVDVYGTPWSDEADVDREGMTCVAGGRPSGSPGAGLRRLAIRSSPERHQLLLPDLHEPGGSYIFSRRATTSLRAPSSRSISWAIFSTPWRTVL